MRCSRFTILFILALSYSEWGNAANTENRPNVLFISVDDLRPELACYGAAHMQTPHIDSLASSGTLFQRAYCQQALCAPSRASLMTGLRPATCGVTNLVTHIRLKRPDGVTLPQQFKNHGYHAVSFGKIYHPGLDDPQSWSEPAWFPPGPEYGSTETVAKLEALRTARQADRYIPGKAPSVLNDPVTGLALKFKHPKAIVMGPSTEHLDLPDEIYEDGQSVEHATAALRRLKDKPFFLAVGFNRPHLPFVAPAKYWDMYPPEKIKLAANPFPPADVPKVAMHDVGELSSYWDIKTTQPVAETQQRQLLRGYFASVSYVDALVGKLLAELDAQNLSDNTIVVFWGDHGYQLGEHGLWCKHTNFEVATQVPLIVRLPGRVTAGAKSPAVVELVDVYPTLCELAGLPAPADLEGASLLPLLKNAQLPWKRIARSEYPVRGGVFGRSIRTDRYRYTEWVTSETQRLVGVELYDHDKDPQENVNVGLKQENVELTKTLSAQLRGNW